MKSKRYNLNEENREMLAVIGKHLRYFREKAGMTILELSKKSGANRTSLYAAEQGKVTYYLILWVYVIFCDADMELINNIIISNVKFDTNKKTLNDYGNLYPEIHTDYTIELQERDHAKKILNDKYGVNNNGK